MRTILACLVVLGACGAPAPDPETSTETQALDDHRWWYSASIPVCFEDTSPATATARGWIQSAVEQSWERGIAADFTGWGQCASGAQGVHVAFRSSDGVLGLGAYLDGMNDGVQIDIGAPEATVRDHAINLFGNVLGFQPEPCQPDLDAGIGPPCTEPTFSDGNGRIFPSWVHEASEYYGGNTGNVMIDEGVCFTAALPGGQALLTYCDELPEETFWHNTPWSAPRYQQWLEAQNGLCLEPAPPTKPVRSVPCDDSTPIWNPTAMPSWLTSYATGAIEGFAGNCLSSTTQSHDPVNHQGCDHQSEMFLEWPSWLGFTIMDWWGRCLVPSHDDYSTVIFEDDCNPYDPDTKWVWSNGGMLTHFLSGLCLTYNTTRPDLYALGIQYLALRCFGDTRQRWDLETDFGANSQCIEDYEGFTDLVGEGCDWEDDGARYFP